MSDAAATPAGPSDAAGPSDPSELLHSRNYLVLLVTGAIVGVPVAAVAYFFLALVAEAQSYLFTTLPDDLGFDDQPSWWPIPLLVASGLLVALAISLLPGSAGHEPAEGFKPGGVVDPAEVPGIAVAAFATLSLGVVLGPEAPLIAIGSGMGALLVRTVRRDAPQTAVMVIGAAGSFAAISSLLMSPIAAAFLLMEASGLGGALMVIVLLPGLVAAGIGALIYVGLDDWTGLGTFSLAVPDLPAAGSPTGVQFLWAIAIGLLAALVGSGISRGARALQPLVARRRLVLTPVAGLVIGLVVLVFVELTDRGSEYVLFSGQDQLAPLLEDADSWTIGALVLLIVCKGAAYVVALSGFRGGPVFPAMFIGAAGGIALSHLPGLPMVVGAGMGIGAMTAAMLRLPLVSVLLVALFMASDGLQLIPVVIVAVVVSYVASAHLDARHTSAPAVEP